MKFIHALIIFAILPLLAGYFVAASHAKKQVVVNNLNFNPKQILPTDKITLTEQGNIISVNTHGIITVPTHNAQLIQSIPWQDNFISVDKELNYSSLLVFSKNGSLTSKLQNGDTGNIDTMNWFTDPALSPDAKQLAFVSDKNKGKTHVEDNALFVENFETKTVEKEADPDSHSGGIAHPVWNPTNVHELIYDYYSYTRNFSPYSTIDEYNTQTQQTTHLTTPEQNAYQAAFSPDGKQLLFLERGDNIKTTLYLADVTNDGLSNIQSLATGDFAYPQFSHTPNNIYYLMANSNTGYNLYVSRITGNRLTSTNAVSTGDQLLGNSGFIVRHN